MIIRIDIPDNLDLKELDKFVSLDDKYLRILTSVFIDDEGPIYASGLLNHFFENKENTALKWRKGDYVGYRYDYLLNNLAREIHSLEEYRKWKEQDNDD